METLIELLKKTEEYFKKKQINNPRLEAEKLFSKSLNMDRIMLYANFNKIITEEEKNIIKKSLNENDKISDNNIKSFLDKSIEYLKKNNINEASLISELIFSNELKVDRMMLFMEYNKELKGGIKSKISNNLKKIAIDKLPYQYIVNKQNFYGRDFYVDKGVLIPRYDTEILVDEALKRIKNDELVLDIGTGSGVIGITIALEKEKTKVLAVDISDKAIEVANINKNNLLCNNIKIVKSNLFENIDFKSFDFIISNPPYISNGEIEEMSLDTYIHEPHEALFAKADGLYYYYEISKQAVNYLKENGYIAFEIGYKQKEAVVDILKEFGYVEIEVIKDFNNKDRVVIAKKGKK